MHERVIAILGLALSCSLVSPGASAAGPNTRDACPVGLVSGLTLDQEFGSGGGDLTRCLQKRRGVLVVFQLNSNVNPNNNSGCYALNDIAKVIDDYEITNGMVIGRDYQIAAIVHGIGGTMVVKDGVNGYANPCQSQVEALIFKGVKFYFSQSTARGFLTSGRLTQGLVTAQVIDGVGYVTDGLTALADFQSSGWTYVQP